MVKVQPGYMPLGKHQTYYRIVGELSEKPPLMLTYGGPAQHIIILRC